MKISIIVPIYNLGEFYINRCVSSILAQTYKDFELILVDDGSTDSSKDICDLMLLKDKRIRVLHKENGGAASARIYGVEHSKGVWITFVDGDDVVTPNALKDLLETPDIHNYDIVVGTIIINNQYIFKHQIDKRILDKYEYIDALLLGKTSIGPYAKLFNKKLFADKELIAPKEIIQNEDLLLLITLASNAKTIYINQNAVCYNYVFRNDSVSKSQSMPFNTWITLFNIIQKRLWQITDCDKLKKSFFIYRLNRLYLNNILKGNVFDTNNEYIQSLINESHNYSLSFREQRIVKLLNHKYLRKIRYYLHKFTISNKSLIKNLITRK